MIHRLGSDDKLPVSHALYLNNFKGINNIGGGKEYNEGLARYLNLNLKISQVDCPLLEDIGVEPFLFANAALIRPQSGAYNTWNEAFRGSCGFGVLGFYRHFALEAYVTMKTQGSQPAGLIQFNFGID